MSRPVDEYVEAEVYRLLTEHPDLAEQGLVLHRGGDGTLLVQGEVESPHRRDEVCRLLGEQFPDVRVRCDLGVTRAQAPVDTEEL